MDDPLWNYRCKSVRVVDGDTIYMLIDVGFNMTTVQSVRLLGINTPELHRGTAEERHAGVVARDAVTNWLAGAGPRANVTDWPLRISTSKSDSFGRWLGNITTPEGASLNEWLLKEGYAQPWKAGA